MTLSNRLGQELDEIAINFQADGTDDVVDAAVVESPDEMVSTHFIRWASVALERNILRSTFPRTMREMRARIEELEQRVENLEEALQHIELDEVIVLQTITREEAKQEILELFHSGETLFYSDIAKRLRLDLELVVELCQELKQEGEVEVDANYPARGR